MGKIGIATPFKVQNYGTKLQAYAISKYISNEYDGTVEILNYTPSSDRRIKTVLRKLLSPSRNIARFRRIIAKNEMPQLDQKYLKARKLAINSFDKLLPLSKSISGYKELRAASREYDCIICGSDQIWLPDNLKDQYYTLEFCNNEKTKKGSYAASLGVHNLAEKEKKQYARFLKGLDFISVRERVGKELLQSFYNQKNIEWVCDPTLLLTQEQWRAIEKKPAILDEHSCKYVFCYFLGTQEEPRKKVYAYAKEKGLKIVTVADFKKYCEADHKYSDIQLYDLSVNEFLYMIDHASLVCTDSMHATIFSVIFESDFAVFERFMNSDKNSRNSRIYSLLMMLGLNNRLVTNGRIPDGQIDFDAVAFAKGEYIASSRKFIKKVLSDVH